MTDQELYYDHHSTRDAREAELGERVVDAEVTPASTISTGNAPWRGLSETSRGYAQVTSRKTIWRQR